MSYWVTESVCAESLENLVLDVQIWAADDQIRVIIK